MLMDTIKIDMRIIRRLYERHFSKKNNTCGLLLVNNLTREEVDTLEAYMNSGYNNYNNRYHVYKEFAWGTYGYAISVNEAFIY